LGNLTLPSIDVNVSDMYQLSVTVYERNILSNTRRRIFRRRCRQ
jgi:hypothetical protein